MADRQGICTRAPAREDTPTLVESARPSATHRHRPVNQIVDDVSDLPRVDVPGSWIDFVVQSDKPFFIEPLFTRDPRVIKPVHVLMAMMAIRGVYEKHQVQSLNHGIGFNTAAIELILPTYGEQLGLKGKICRNWVLNPHPTLIPAIETGWVESVHCFGAEWDGRLCGCAARRFFTGRDGPCARTAPCASWPAVRGRLFIGATLQMDGVGNSSTVTNGRLAGFGARRTMGHDPHGRRIDAGLAGPIETDDPLARGKKWWSA